jgi:hypothetical protein
MLAFVWTLTLALAPPPPAPPNPWRLVATPVLHVGARPAVYVSRDEMAFGATVQVTVRWL